MITLFLLLVRRWHPVPVGGDTLAGRGALLVAAFLACLAVLSVWPLRFSGPLGRRERRAVTRRPPGWSVVLTAVGILGLLDAICFLFTPAHPSAVLVLHSRLRAENDPIEASFWGTEKNRVDLGPCIDQTLDDLVAAGVSTSAVGSAAPSIRHAIQEVVGRRVAEFDRKPLPGGAQVQRRFGTAGLPAWVVESVELSAVQLLMATDDVSQVRVAASRQKDTQGGWTLARSFWREPRVVVRLSDTPANEPGLRVRRVGRATYSQDRATGEVCLEFSAVVDGPCEIGRGPFSVGFALGLEHLDGSGSTRTIVLPPLTVAPDGKASRFVVCAGSTAPRRPAAEWEEFSRSRVWLRDVQGDVSCLVAPVGGTAAPPVLRLLDTGTVAQQWQRLFARADQPAPSPSPAFDPYAVFREKLRRAGTPLPRLTLTATSAQPGAVLVSSDTPTGGTWVVIASSQEAATAALAWMRTHSATSVPTDLQILRGRSLQGQVLTAFSWAESPVTFAGATSPASVRNAPSTGFDAAPATAGSVASARSFRHEAMPLVIAHRERGSAVILQLGGHLTQVLPAVSTPAPGGSPAPSATPSEGAYYDPVEGLALLDSVARACIQVNGGGDPTPATIDSPAIIEPADLPWSGPCIEPVNLEEAVAAQQRPADLVVVVALGLYLALTAWLVLSSLDARLPAAASGRLSSAS